MVCDYLVLCNSKHFNFFCPPSPSTPPPSLLGQHLTPTYLKMISVMRQLLRYVYWDPPATQLPCTPSPPTLLLFLVDRQLVGVSQRNWSGLPPPFQVIMV